MRIQDLLSNENFLNQGALQYVTARGKRWLLCERSFQKCVLHDITRAVVALRRRDCITVSRRVPTHALMGRPFAIAKLTRGFHFLITPSCHGNGGWCGYTIHRAASLPELLRLHPGKMGLAGDGEFGDDRARICRIPDPNKGIILWDREDGRWTNRSGKPVTV